MQTIAQQIEALPNDVGIYLFYNEKNELLYIGKSIHIKKRVRQHFQGTDRKSLKIRSQTHSIKFETTGNALIALLYESELIKRELPLYNRALRKTKFQYGLYTEDIQGYTALRIYKTQANSEAVTSFTTIKEAKQVLYNLTEQYQLCQKINGLYHSKGGCFQYQIKECKGACIQLEKPEAYNARVHLVLNTHQLQKHTQLFQLRGRSANEIALVYIEKGIYKGYGYCPANTPESDYLQFIKPKEDHKDARRILIRFLISQD